MAADEGGKPILKIPVERAEWDEFVDSFMAYQKLLEEQGPAWASTNKGIKQTKTAFDDVESTFDKLVKQAIDPKLTGNSGAFAKITKNSKDTEKAWRSVSKEFDRLVKSAGSLARLGVTGLGGLGIFGGALGAAAGGLAAATANADNDLASQNLLNRRLGLKPGEEKAFDTVYDKAGGDTALLGKISVAKSTPQEWRYLMAAGISAEDIKTKDPVELAQEFMRAMSDKQKQMSPEAFGAYAKAVGVTNIADMPTLKAMGSYGADDYAKMGEQYQKLQPQLAQQQKTLDEATAAKQAFDAAWQRDVTELDKILVRLNPDFIKLADGLTKMVTAFAESGELDKDIQTLEHVFGKLETAIEAVVHWLEPFAKKDKDDQTQMGSGLMDVYKDLKEGNFAKAWQDANRPLNGTQTQTPAPQQTPGYDKDKVLDAIRMNESSGKAGKVNPASGAAGYYGLMPDNVRAMGVDPDDPVASRKAAAKILDDQLRAFNGDLGKALAGYDGDTHVKADEKKFGGAWWQGAKPETIDYLKKMETQGIDLNLPEEAQTWIDAHTTVKDDPKVRKAVRDADAVATTPSYGESAPQIVPFTAADARAKAADDQPKAQTEGIIDRMHSSLVKFANSFKEGSGAQFRMPDQQQSRPAGNPQVVPYNINVTVTSPAGSSTTVTAGGIAQ